MTLDDLLKQAQHLDTGRYKTLTGWTEVPVAHWDGGWVRLMGLPDGRYLVGAVCESPQDAADCLEILRRESNPVKDRAK